MKADSARRISCWSSSIGNDQEISVVVFVGLRLNYAWASGTVLKPFLQPESPLSSRSLVSGFKCKLQDLNSRPPYSRPRALTTRLYAPSTMKSQYTMSDLENINSDIRKHYYLKVNILYIIFLQYALSGRVGQKSPLLLEERRRERNLVTIGAEVEICSSVLRCWRIFYAPRTKGQRRWQELNLLVWTGKVYTRDTI